MKRLIKLIKYIYSINKLHSLDYKIKILQIKKDKIDMALQLGFYGERHFVESIKNYNNKLKDIDVKNNNKKRLQELAGIKKLEETEKLFSGKTVLEGIKNGTI